MLSALHHAISRPLLCAFAFFPGFALAEVSDKEPSVHLFWTVGLIAGLLCLYSARLKPWLGALVFVPAALWFISLFLEIHTADVGPHLLHEQGMAYYAQAYASFAAVLCGLILGFIWHRRSSPFLQKESLR